MDFQSTGRSLEVCPLGCGEQMVKERCKRCVSLSEHVLLLLPLLQWSKMCQFPTGEQRHRGGEAGDDRRAADGHRDILDNLSGWCVWSAGLCAEGDTAELNLKVRRKKTCAEDDSCPEPTCSQHVRIYLGSMAVHDNNIRVCEAFCFVFHTVPSLWLEIACGYPSWVFPCKLAAVQRVFLTASQIKCTVMYAK